MNQFNFFSTEWIYKKKDFFVATNLLTEDQTFACRIFPYSTCLQYLIGISSVDYTRPIVGSMHF